MDWRREDYASNYAFPSQNILDSNYFPSFFFEYSIIYLIDIFYKSVSRKKCYGFSLW